MTRIPLSIASLSLVCSMLIGCGGPVRPDGMPALQPTTITVTQNGTPLAGATVTLHPQTGGLQPWGCGGVTDSSGNISPTTRGNFPGVAAGKFTVTVEKTDADPPIHVDGEMTAAQREADNKRKTYDLVDPKFADPKTSGLEIEITSGKNTKAIDVGAAVRKAR